MRYEDPNITTRCVDAPDKLPPVQTAIGLLSTNISRLSDKLDKLGAKLTPVLGHAPSPPNAEKIGHEPVCAIEAEIQQAAMQISSIHEAVAILLESLAI